MELKHSFMELKHWTEIVLFWNDVLKEERISVEAASGSETSMRLDDEEVRQPGRRQLGEVMRDS